MSFHFINELNQSRDETQRFLADRRPTAVPRRTLEGPEPEWAEPPGRSEDLTFTRLRSMTAPSRRQTSGSEAALIKGLACCDLSTGHALSIGVNR
jgi:hypothetical protein